MIPSARKTIPLIPNTKALIVPNKAKATNTSTNAIEAYITGVKENWMELLRTSNL